MEDTVPLYNTKDLVNFPATLFSLMKIHTGRSMTLLMVKVELGS